MESRSIEGDRTGEGGGGDVLKEPSTSQSTDKEATKSKDGRDSERDQNTLPTESHRCARIEAEDISPDSTGDQGTVEGVESESEKEIKTASKEETDESLQRVPTETAATEAAGTTQAEEGGSQQEAKAKEGGGGGGWTWGGFSNIWSSVSTMTESTAQALGEKVS